VGIRRATAASVCGCTMHSGSGCSYNRGRHWPLAT